MGYLVACGWQVEAHRFRIGRHDLDLIVRRGRLVAFVEVKTRRSLRCGSALESVSALKRRSIERVALGWRLRHPDKNTLLNQVTDHLLRLVGDDPVRRAELFGP